VQSTMKKFSHQIKEVKTSFTGTKLTAYSGISVVGKYLKKTKLFQKFNTLFPTVVQNATQYTDAQISLLLVLSSLCKVNRYKNIETFSADPLIMTTLNTTNKISDSRLCERIQSMGEQASRNLESFALEQNKEFLVTKTAERLTIDIDSTVSIVYGNQEGSVVGYNPQKKGAASYHPLLAFLSDYKMVMHTWFRTGNAYTSNGCEDFIRQINAHVPTNIGKIFYRCDSGFFDNQLIQTMEDAGNDYLIKVKLKGLVQLLKPLNWDKIEGQANMWSTEFDYIFKIKDEEGKTVPVARTLRAIRIKKHLGIGNLGEEIYEWEYFCYCTNLIGLNTNEIHELYGKRGNCENWIEQVKNQLLAGKTLTNNFWANDIFWQLCVFAYNLSILMRQKIAKVLKQEYNTFRDWFVRVPGELIRTANQLILKIYSQYIYKEQWEDFSCNFQTE